MLDEVIILAVDDQDTNLQIINSILSDLDYRVLKSNNGQQALEVLAAELHIDIVLLDLNMPIMNGLETLRIIRENSDWCNIPVIIASSDTVSAIHSLTLGADDYIAKPFNPIELRKRVMNYVRFRRLASLANDKSNT